MPLADWIPWGQLQVTFTEELIAAGITVQLSALPPHDDLSHATGGWRFNRTSVHGQQQLPAHPPGAQLLEGSMLSTG